MAVTSEPKLPHSLDYKIWIFTSLLQVKAYNFDFLIKRTILPIFFYSKKIIIALDRPRGQFRVQ